MCIIGRLGRVMAERVSKLNVWLKHYLNEGCKTTFLNKIESAKAAKYKCTTQDSYRSVGYQNFIKCADKIKVWLDEHGLSENALKIKMLSLMEAKEKKFFSTPMKDKTGCTTGILIEDVEVEAIETQRKTLDMALKVKGMNAPEKHIHGFDTKTLNIILSALPEEYAAKVKAQLSEIIKK